MKQPVPTVLIGTPWEPWLQECPHYSQFETIDGFRKAFNDWANHPPGHNAVPNPIEAATLAFWLTRLELDLLDARIGETDLQQETLVYSFISLIGAIAGAAASAMLGAAAAGIAASAISVGLAFIGVYFAGTAVLKAARKARENSILSGLRRRARALANRFW